MNAANHFPGTLQGIAIKAILAVMIGIVACGLSFRLVSADGALEAEDWMERQVWFGNLAASMPEGVGLALSRIEGDEPGWASVVVRETHSEESGFDPAVSPTVGIFRISTNREMIEWMDPVTGEWSSISAFLRSRKAEPGGGQSMMPESSALGTKSESGSAGLIAVEPPSLFSGDLDGDGRTDTVRLVAMDSTDSNRYFSLEVIGGGGDLLWSGPTEKSLENAYVFFTSHFGSSLPQLLTDYDGDGYSELLAPEPQSDVSPTFYRRLKWKDGAFRPLSSSALMRGGETGDALSWVEGDVSYGTWVSRFVRMTADGLAEAGITQYTEAGVWKGGIALLRFTPTGAMIEEWLHPLSGDPPSISGNEEPGLGNAEVADATRFPLSCGITLEYSEKANSLLRSRGGKLTAMLIVDEYGPVYMEEEGIASLDLKFAPGESVRIDGIPFRNPQYQIKPDRNYKLTVMILPDREEGEDLPVEIYSATGEVDWNTREIQGRMLTHHCRLVSEGMEVPMRQWPDTPASTRYDPFSEVDPEQFFVK